MFYEPDKNDHGLPHNPYKSCVVPRPIGWITSVSRDGALNLAPYSQFNNLGYDPPYVMFSAGCRPDGSLKDSVKNATETGEFVCNMATWDMRDAVNTTSQLVDPDVNEAELAGMETAPSRLVKPPRLAASPVNLECVYHGAMVLPGYSPSNVVHMVVGRVVGVHIRDDALTADGLIDIARIKPLARLGYLDYTCVETVHTMAPTGPQADQRRKGLGGEAEGKPGVAAE